MPKEATNTQMKLMFCGLSAGGPLARGGGVQAEAGAHALLPGALLSFAFFNLRPDARQRLASELAHLDVKKCRDNRDEWDYEDVCKFKNLLNNLRGR